jgi:hypothetical protein
MLNSQIYEIIQEQKKLQM